MWNHSFHTLIAIYHHLHQVSAYLRSRQHNLLVPTRGTFARVLGLPAETQRFRATEGWRSPDLLPPLAVYTLKHSLFGLQSL